jgi:hypothetical protein
MRQSRNETAKQHARGRQLGLESQKKGRTFEEKVAHLYRLLHYDVQAGRVFSARQVDLFLKGKFGDLNICRAIECKAGPVRTEHLDDFLLKLQLVRHEYPTAQGTIVSGVSFTDAATTHASRIGVQLITYSDLSAQLFDGNAYARELVAECETNTRYRLTNYMLTPEVLLFIYYSIDIEVVYALLEDILVSKYTPEVSENALVCLYGLKRRALFERKKIAKLEIRLPTNVNLARCARER